MTNILSDFVHMQVRKFQNLNGNGPCPAPSPRLVSHLPGCKVFLSPRAWLQSTLSPRVQMPAPSKFSEQHPHCHPISQAMQTCAHIEFLWVLLMGWISAHVLFWIYSALILLQTSCHISPELIHLIVDIFLKLTFGLYFIIYVFINIPKCYIKKTCIVSNWVFIAIMA